MNVDNNIIVNDFLSFLLNQIDNENIMMRLSEKTKSEVKLESPDNSIIIKFIVDIINHKILYDIYFSEDKKHLRERTISDFEKMYSLQRQKGKEHLPKYLPDAWMILDEIHAWAKKANFKIIGKTLT